MKTLSLRWRVVILASAVISAVLVLSGSAFHWLFRSHVEEFVLTELNSHFEQLAAGLAMTDTGQVAFHGSMSDPRFEQPAGGLYWQVDVPGQGNLRSRSLWDAALAVPTPPDTAEEDHAHVMPLPFGGEIFALEKMVILTAPDGKEVKTVVTVGLDRAPVTEAANDFAGEITVSLILLYLALLLGSLGIVLLGLSPLQRLRNQLAVLNEPEGQLPEAEFPSEVLPLVTELNTLAKARAAQLERARSRASNLAHGLKTPLTVLSSLADRLSDNGDKASGSNIDTQVSLMRDLVDRELAKSRMAGASTSHRANLNDVFSRVVETMKRAPRGENLTWSIDIKKDATIAMDRVDLLELAGNLTDNARKHASEMVRIAYDGKTLVVEDDGPGVAAENLPAILERGVKLDQLGPTVSDSHGIGLAIVKDLADAYGATLAFERSPLGGLAVLFSLPSMAKN